MRMRVTVVTSSVCLSASDSEDHVVFTLKMGTSMNYVKNLSPVIVAFFFFLNQTYLRKQASKITVTTA